MDNLPNDKNMLTIIEAREKLRFKQEWAAFVKENEQQPLQETTAPKSKTRLRILTFKKYAAAASIALLIGLGAYWAYSNLNPVPESYMALAEEYQTIYPPPHLDNLKSMPPDQLKAIQAAYAEKNYPATLAAIQAAYPDKLPEDKILQIRGFAFFHTGAYSNAIQDFEQLIANAQISADDALWYLALAYLKNTPPSPEKAQANLEQLQQDYDSKDAQAQAVMEDLKRMKED